MGTIAKADFLIIADSCAAQSQELAKELGDGAGGGGFGAGGSTSSDGAQNNIDGIIAFTDSEVIDELISAARSQLDKLLTVPSAYTPFTPILRALNTHVSGIDAYLTAQAERVAPEFKTMLEMQVGEQLTAANTFPPVLLDLGEITIDAVDPPGGAGASSTFVDGSAIDITNYFAANLVLVKQLAAKAADALTITISCVEFDGTAVDEDVAVDASDAINTSDDIGVHGTDMYYDVTDMVIKAGSEPTIATTVNERWQVNSELERTVAL